MNIDSDVLSLIKSYSPRYIIRCVNVNYSKQDAGWERIRALVGGRLVNGYSKNDLVLSVMYR